MEENEELEKCKHCGCDEIVDEGHSFHVYDYTFACGSQVMGYFSYGDDEWYEKECINLEEMEETKTKELQVYVTEFARIRHWSRGKGATYIPNMPVEDFENMIARIIANNAPDVRNIHWDEKLGSMELRDSHMPFCKYLVIDNFTEATPSSMEINADNFQYLRSGYSSRTSEELPYLGRWLDFPFALTTPANKLVLILYSQEQLDKEGSNREGLDRENKNIWGVVGMQANDTGVVDPMTPATIVRNAMGIEYGGNGVEIDQDYLREAAKYWETHAVVKAGV